MDHFDTDVLFGHAVSSRKATKGSTDKVFGGLVVRLSAYNTHHDKCRNNKTSETGGLDEGG